MKEHFIIADISGNEVEVAEYWIRKCDECGYEQVSREPDRSKELPASYENKRCHKCQSTGLDYGRPVLFDKELNRWEEDEDESGRIFYIQTGKAIENA